MKKEPHNKGKVDLPPDHYTGTLEQWQQLSRARRWSIRYPERQKAASAASRAKNPEHYKNRHRKYVLRNLYGMTEEQYQELLIKQGHCCAICGTDKPTGKWRTFGVDHCHHTGKVRGLLCNECNRGIGLLKDSPELVLKAYDYLKNHHDAKTAIEKNGRV